MNACTSSRCLLATLLGAAALLAGCAAPAPKYDYSSFLKAKPATLLVLPPQNDSPDVDAGYSLWSHATLPLAEGGYYVLPVTLVDETFRQNGVTTAHDAHQIPVAKLREVFGADAAVYMRVRQFGTTYMVFGSDTRVTVDARIVDLRSGEELWKGSATASSTENRQQTQGGLIGLLVTAIVEQIANTATDASHKFAGVASQRLLSPRVNGVLPGPRSPRAGQVPGAKP